MKIDNPITLMRLKILMKKTEIGMKKFDNIKKE